MPFLRANRPCGCVVQGHSRNLTMKPCPGHRELAAEASHKTLMAEAEKALEERYGGVTMNVREMVEGYLKANGFDGLFQTDGECGCDVGDLMPGCDGREVGSCQPGYKREGCRCAERDHDFHIERDKE